jgi:uncharacterized membrane protein
MNVQGFQLPQVFNSSCALLLSPSSLLKAKHASALFLCTFNCCNYWLLFYASMQGCSMSFMALRPSPACLARQQRLHTAVPQPAAAAARNAQVRRLHLCRSNQQDGQAPELQQAEAAGSSPATNSVEQQTATPTTPADCGNSSSSTFPYGVMAALASAGAAETLYLTASKLLNASVACPTSGCDAVLSSPYAQLFGVPLPLLGAAAYTAVALAAGSAASTARSGRAVPSWLSSGLAAGVCGLAATSAYLMYILQSQLGGAPCVWCWASAGISGLLFSSLLAGMDKRQMADAAGPGLGATAAALAVLYAGFGPLGGSGISNAAELELPYVSPVVTTESSQQTLSLAHRLREAGAVMYGAFWCRWVQGSLGGRSAVLEGVMVAGHCSWLLGVRWCTVHWVVPVALAKGEVQAACGVLQTCVVMWLFAVVFEVQRRLNPRCWLQTPDDE